MFLAIVYIVASWTMVLLPEVEALTSASKPKWEPKILDIQERRKLRGKLHDSETVGSLGFHHVEFYCGDAKSTSKCWSLALGMPIVGETGQFTGNDQCVSYGLASGDVRFLLTAAYPPSHVQSSSSDSSSVDDKAPHPLPGFCQDQTHKLFAKHGVFARAVGIQVRDAKAAFDASVSGGAKPVLEPTLVGEDGCQIAEVELYGDVVLRYVSGVPKQGPFLPHLAPSPPSSRPTFGLRRIDHAVGNVENLAKQLNYMTQFTGFHEFAEFTSEDVGTVDSGLNSVVLASDTEDVLLPINEPTDGKRKSQIQTFLEQNQGAGLQHLALKTDDIIGTITEMRRAEEELGIGFELMKRPSDEYYRELPSRIGDQLSEIQYQQIEELGILADADDEGLLLQIFTKPIGDRPTFFFEIIQRVGCHYKPEHSDIELERPGCGGFGQGNFRELFKAIEEHEKTLKV